MRYRQLEYLLHSHGWSSDEDDQGDMYFYRGDAGFWIQWDNSEDDLDDAYLWYDEAECYICNIVRLIFTPTRLSIIWNDNDIFDFYY